MCDNSSMWWWIAVLFLHVCKQWSPAVQHGGQVGMSNINIVSSASISGTYQFLLRGVVETKMEKEWGRGGRKKKKQEMEMFLFDLGRSLNLLFASLLWFKLLRLRTWCILYSWTTSIRKAISLIGNVTSEMAFWKTSKIATALPTRSEHMHGLTCTKKSILLLIPVLQYNPVHTFNPCVNRHPQQDL